jgi:chemotaxis signal transduction protein
MTTMVCFRTGSTAYCVPVAATRAVRTTFDMMAMPRTRRGVAGIIPGDPPLTVIAPLGSGGSHVLVIEAAGKTFGLLVDTVTGLYQVDAASIRNAPDGQIQQLVSGTVERDGDLMLVADPDALAGRLDGSRSKRRLARGAPVTAAMSAPTGAGAESGPVR